MCFVGAVWSHLGDMLREVVRPRAPNTPKKNSQGKALRHLGAHFRALGDYVGALSIFLGVAGVGNWEVGGSIHGSP